MKNKEKSIKKSEMAVILQSPIIIIYCLTGIELIACCIQKTLISIMFQQIIVFINGHPVKGLDFSKSWEVMLDIMVGVYEE